LNKAAANAAVSAKCTLLHAYSYTTTISSCAPQTKTLYSLLSKVATSVVRIL